jgi:DNA repair photolyase
LKTKKIGIIGVSTVTDPYQPVEKKTRLTRYCLEQLLLYDFPVCIQTKSSLVIRDLDIITKLSKAEVMMSIGTINDEERRLLEPGSSSIQQRLKVLETYADTGVKTSVFFGPIYPSVKERDIADVLSLFVEHGVTEIMIDDLHLKPGVWNNIMSVLRGNPSLTRIFKKHLFQDKEYYQRIRNSVMEFGKETTVNLVNTF